MRNHCVVPSNFPPQEFTQALIRGRLCRHLILDRLDFCNCICVFPCTGGVGFYHSKREMLPNSHFLLCLRWIQHRHRHHSLRCTNAAPLGYEFTNAAKMHRLCPVWHRTIVSSSILLSISPR